MKTLCLLCKFTIYNFIFPYETMTLIFSTLLINFVALLIYQPEGNPLPLQLKGLWQESSGFC